MRTHLGEILSGDRTYFPEPVAYDNQRRPIIPAQLGARPIPMAAAEGLGAVVPGFRSTLGTMPAPPGPAPDNLTIPLWVVAAVVAVGVLMAGRRSK